MFLVVNSLSFSVNFLRKTLTISPKMSLFISIVQQRHGVPPAPVNLVDGLLSAGGIGYGMGMSPKGRLRDPWSLSPHCRGILSPLGRERDPSSKGLAYLQGRLGLDGDPDILNWASLMLAYLQVRLGLEGGPDILHWASFPCNASVEIAQS